MATFTDRVMVLQSNGLPARISSTDTIELSAGNLIVGGDLTVSGTKFTNNAETVLIADNHSFMNAGYTTAAAQTGGLVVNYLPTATADTTVGAGVFVAGVDGASDPTVTTAGSATFAATDLVQVAGTANGGENDGLYEVQGHVGTLLTLKSTADGVTNLVEDFTDGQFVANAGDTGATVTKVTVSIMRAGTDGIWETGSGSATPITFSDLSSAGGVTLNQAYTAGNTITLSDAEGDLAITLDDTGAAADFQVTDSGGDYILTDAANNKLLLGSAANSVNLLDNVLLELGTGDDLTLAHNGTNSFVTSKTGDLTIDNQDATGTTAFTLGTDTSATGFEVQNDSAAAKFKVDGAGQVTVTNNLDVGGGIDIPADSQTFTMGAGGDLSIVHNGTNTVTTSTTGNYIVDNTSATGSTIMGLGTDTSATGFGVQNDSGTQLFGVAGDGQVLSKNGYSMDERTTPASINTDQGIVYVKNDATDTELFFYSDLNGTDTDLQISKDGFLNVDALVNTEFVAAAGGVTAGDALYLASGTEVGLADATTASGANFVIGIAGNTAAAAATVQLRAFPAKTVTTTAITGFAAAGEVVYLSETAGDYTVTAPTTSGSTVFRVGYAVTSTSVLFAPQLVAINP